MTRESLQILLKRKTLIGWILIANTASFVWAIVDTVSNYREFSSEIPSSLVNSSLTIDIIILIADGIRVLMLGMAQYWWNQYYKSAKFIKVAGFVMIYLPLIYLFFPFIKIFNFDEYHHYLIQIQIYYDLFLTVMPNLLLIQSVLSTSNTLIPMFINTHEFNLLSQVLLAIYIPVYSIALGIIFQLDMILVKLVYRVKY